MKAPGKKLRTNLRRAQLHDASLAELLLHGLSAGEDSPAIGVLTALRSDVDALMSMAPDDGEHADMLDGIVRRLDVALELLARGTR